MHQQWKNQYVLGLNEIIHVQDLTQCSGHDKCQMKSSYDNYDNDKDDEEKEEVMN